MDTTRDLTHRLTVRQIRPSKYRIDILEYMTVTLSHPTAETIHKALKKKHPKLSLTTVYNTMKTFVDAGLVRALDIEGDEIRYDLVTDDHGHFKCESCGTIYNFNIDPDKLASSDLDGFRIRDRQVHFRGYCLDCQAGKSPNKGGR